MRRCRSNSPLRSSCCPSRTCCPPGCCKPCCLPTRRCRSSSPRRSSCRPLYAGSCYDPCGPCNPCGPWDACEQVCCSPRRRRCYPRKTCSPYSPRRCPPCAPGRCSVSPSCYTPSRCDPCLQRQCEPCYPWRYDSYYRSSICEPCDPCYPSTCGPCDPCDPCYPKRYTSCYPKSCGPCYPKKGSACDSCCDTSCYSCFPWRYRSTRSYSPSVCDPCYPRSRDPCLPRKCSSYKPCYSPTCSMCFPSSCKSRCLSPCSDCPVEERIVKSGRIVCDTFSKVCYPCDRPISRYGLNVCGNCKVDPCCCSFNPPYKATPTCQVAKISSPCEPPDEGPSCDFLDKSRKLGKCLNRYDPHYCPWEADISVSGTIRGHCSSTAAEVARRMTGRFKSRGERYTTDSLAKKTCPDEPQKMSLGMLDDGTVLNLSRNNKPTTAKDGYNETTNRSHSSVRIMSPPDGNGARGSRRNRKLRRYDKENESEEENRSSSEETTPPSQVVRGPRFCEYSYKNRKVADTSPSDHRVSSHRSNNKNRADYVDSHRTSGLRSMRYRSGNEVSDYRTGSDRSGSNSPCTEVRSFLDGRRSRRLSERNRASSMRGEPSRESRARSLSSHRSPGDSIRLHVSPNTHSLNVTSSRHSTSDDSRSFSPPSYAPRRNNRLKRDDGGKSYKSSRYSRTLEDKSNRLSEPGRNPRRVSRADAYQRSRWSRRESESKSNLSDSREYPPYHHHHPHDYRSCLSSRERPWRSRKKRVTYQYAEGD